MTFVCEQIDDRIVIHAPQRFDYNSSQEFRRIIEEQPPDAKFAVDFEATEYLDSSALGMLLVLREFAGGRRAKVQLSSVGEEIRSLLETARFHELFEIV